MEKHIFEGLTEDMKLKVQITKLRSLASKATDPIVLQNCIELLERSKIGVEKYGTTLSDANLSQNELIQHALEESLDLSNYLRTILMGSLSFSAEQVVTHLLQCETLDDALMYFSEIKYMKRKTN